MTVTKRVGTGTDSIVEPAPALELAIASELATSLVKISIGNKENAVSL